MSTKVITGKVRFSYVSIFTPVSANEEDTPKYKVTLLIPKTDRDTMGKIQQAIIEAKDKFLAKNGAASLPPKPKTTLYDGDKEREDGSPFGDECHGCYVITVSSKVKPIIVDSFRNPITDPGEVYSGCYGRAAIDFYGYNSHGKRGISAGLQSIQKLHDGEPLGGSRGSADDFDDGFADLADDIL